MPREDRPDPLALIVIDHDESDLGLAGPDNDVASTASYDGSPVFIDLRHQRDVVFEIDIEKESQLLLRKAFLRREKAPLERLWAGSSDRREHRGPVIGTKCTDLDGSTVAKVLDDRIISGQRHEQGFPVSTGKLCRHLLLREREYPPAMMLDLDQTRPRGGADRLEMQGEILTC